MKSIDRFCAKHPRFGIPNLMLYIVIANAVVYIFSMIDTTNGSFISYLTFKPSRILAGEVWRIITFIFIPQGGSNLLFVALSLYFYYFIGSTLERTWGSGRFTIYYALGYLLLVVFGFFIWISTGSSILPTFISAHYLNLSMFFAFATLYPDTRVLLFFIIPIKIKWLALVDAAYFLYYFLTGPIPINFLPVIAVLNYYLIFCGSDLKYALQPLKYRVSKRNIEFKANARKVEKQKASGAYVRQCSVCGRTEKDYPNLEFRYCSKCDGYHCFCEDHINNHVHFKE